MNSTDIFAYRSLYWSTIEYILFLYFPFYILFVCRRPTWSSLLAFVWLFTLHAMQCTLSSHRRTRKITDEQEKFGSKHTQTLHSMIQKKKKFNPFKSIRDELMCVALCWSVALNAIRGRRTVRQLKCETNLYLYICFPGISVRPVNSQPINFVCVFFLNSSFCSQESVFTHVHWPANVVDKIIFQVYWLERATE